MQGTIVRPGLFGPTKKKALLLSALVATALAALLLSGSAAVANDRASVKIDPATGHSYEYVAGPVDWDAAKAAAALLTHDGVSGHLVTITSQEETDFIVANLQEALVDNGGPDFNRAWIGAIQPAGSVENDGGWTWITGETWDYTEWAPGEPNNSGGENVAQFWNTAGGWNDASDTLLKGYLVEYDTTNLLTNGSFENRRDNTVSFPDPHLQLVAGNTDIAGWTVDSGSIDWIGSTWNASEGVRSIDISGFNVGVISQDFPTADGVDYSVTFDISGNSSCGSTIKTMEGLIAGLSEPHLFSFDTTNNTSPSVVSWESRSFGFTAVSANSMLIFTSLEDSACGAAIDNVSVTVSTGGGTKADILKSSGVDGKGIDKAPGLDKEFNPKGKGGEKAGKKTK